MFRKKSVDAIMKNFSKTMADLRDHAESNHQHADLIEEDVKNAIDEAREKRAEAEKALKIHANLEKLLESAA